MYVASIPSPDQTLLKSFSIVVKGRSKQNRKHTVEFFRNSVSSLTSSSSTPMFGEAIDLISQVKALHGLGSLELIKLLKDSENLSFVCTVDNGSKMQVDMEKFTRLLPLHLIAVTLSSQRDDTLLRYLLCGLRILHSLCEIAPRFPKLEQILLDDVKVSEQLLDLVFYSLIVFSGYQKEHHVAGVISLLHSTAIACSLYLLRGCVSTHWHELAYVLVAHPKVNIFMDASFRAVSRSISFLRINLSALQNDHSMKSTDVAERTINHLCLQCEASLQFLQSLSQHKAFRERLLRNKELCGKGGILQLAQTTLQVNVPTLLSKNASIMAAVSRLKSRVLAILLQLCETESISFLDEVAVVEGSLDSANSVALEILTLAGRSLKQPCSPSGKTYPTGLLQLNALRLVDIFSDDSNFRSFITAHFTEVLARILSLSNQEFLASWCSSDLPEKEEEASLDYDAYGSAGGIIHLSSPEDLENIAYSESTLLPTNVPQASYAHQRTSLLVKVIANLHCFVPKICEEQERNFFLHKFLGSLQLGLPNSSAKISTDADPKKSATVCKNLRLLLGHAESLIPTFLNEEDVQLFRVFYTQLQAMISPIDSEEGQNLHECSLGNGNTDPISRNDILDEGVSDNSALQEVDHSFIQDDPVDEADVIAMQDYDVNTSKFSQCLSRGTSGQFEKNGLNVESSGSDSSSARGNNCNPIIQNGDLARESELTERVMMSGAILEDEKIGTFKSEKQLPRKRKRSIMNDIQVSIVESALVEEPDLHKNAASLQAWAETLCSHGSDVTSSQLKNWLNNRKAKLARIAKDSHPLPEGDACTPNKQEGSGNGTHHSDSPKQPSNDPTNLSFSKVGSGWNQGSMGPSSSAPPGKSHEMVAVQSADRVKMMQVECSTSYHGQLQPGNDVLLIDDQGMHIAHAKIHQVRDEWNGINLQYTKTCVVDIMEYLSETSFGPAHHPLSRGGVLSSDNSDAKTRILWPSDRILMPLPG